MAQHKPNRENKTVNMTMQLKLFTMMFFSKMSIVKNRSELCQI